MVVLVDSEVLQKTPSSVHGVSKKVEEQLRIFGVELIQRAVVLLRLPQTTCVSATILLQRFFFRRSLAEFDVRIVAAAALLLAAKLEETHRRLRDVITVFHRLNMRAAASPPPGFEWSGYAGGPTPGLDATGKDFAEIKRQVIAAERQVLQDLGFAVAGLLEHPHKYVLQFVKSLRTSVDAELCEFAQTAWNYLNDSTRTTLCCEYQPHEIATAAIYLAARKRGVTLPTEPPWWSVFDSRPEIFRPIACRILALYRRAPARYAHVTREPAEPSSQPTLGALGPLLRCVSDASITSTASDVAGLVAAEAEAARLAEVLQGDASAALQLPAPRARSRSRSRGPGPPAVTKQKVVRVTLPTRSVR